MKNLYSVKLTEKELKAIPILINMASVYLWELYSKREGDSYYKQHKENIDMISKYNTHSIGIMAIAEDIDLKCGSLLEDVSLMLKDEKLEVLPIGIESNSVWKVTRFNELKKAINRYSTLGLTIPAEWINEYNILGIENSNEA